MTLHQLKVFQAVSQHLNITKASKELHISQPSVFQQVKSLEDSYGTKLYRKTGKGIELTEEGRLFRLEVEEILRRVDSLEKKFRPQPSPSAGRLVIGASHGPSASLIPSVLTTFKRIHPHVQVTLKTKDSRGMEQLVAESRVELAVVTDVSQVENSPQFCIEPCRQEQLVAFVSTKHPFARKTRISLAELARQPLILKERSESKTRELLKQIEQRGFELNVFMECESAEAVKAAVIKGLGVGVLYRDHLNTEVRRGDLKIVRISDLKRIDSKSFILYKIDQPLSPYARKFLGLLRPAQQKSV
jgi:DNA-binding transcriptional LysR family regulator